MLNYRVECYLHNLYLLSDSGKWKKKNLMQLNIKARKKNMHSHYYPQPETVYVAGVRSPNFLFPVSTQCLLSPHPEPKLDIAIYLAERQKYTLLRRLSLVDIFILACYSFHLNFGQVSTKLRKSNRSRHPPSYPWCSSRIIAY